MRWCYSNACVWRRGMSARIAHAAARPNRFLDAVILFVGCCMLIAHASAAENVLRVLAWPGYADPDVVKGFESRYHAKVEVTLIDSDEALWDKMHQGKTPQFDVLAANTAEIQRYAHDKLLVPLDLCSLQESKRQLTTLSTFSYIAE